MPPRAILDTFSVRECTLSQQFILHTFYILVNKLYTILPANNPLSTFNTHPKDLHHDAVIQLQLCLAHVLQDNTQNGVVPVDNKGQAGTFPKQGIRSLDWVTVTFSSTLPIRVSLATF